MYVLDTDILGLWWRRQEKVVARVLVASALHPLVTTTITRIELLEGRFSNIRTAASGDELAKAVSRLSETVRALSQLPELEVDHRAVEIFDRLRVTKRLKKMGRMDLLIACVTLANGATLVTRNVKDFNSVPDLRVENWAD
ncbi:MAG: type II toxin-antitoxin system VapC family toxin [Gemmataceae bacterium]